MLCEVKVDVQTKDADMETTQHGHPNTPFSKINRIRYIRDTLNIWKMHVLYIHKMNKKNSLFQSN